MFSMDFNEIIRNISIAIIPIIFAVTFHEAAHAFAAKWLGDDTAHRQGRTSLNPMVHIDPIGTVLLPLATYIFTGFIFGYAKPVPVIASRFRKPTSDMSLVALAGPAANAIMAVIWAFIAVFSMKLVPEQEFFIKVAEVGVIANLLFFAFNLLPILPLDGGRILVGILPAGLARYLMPLEQYGMFIILFLAISGSNIIGNYWVWPIMKMMQNLLVYIITPLQMLLGLA